MYTQFRDLFRSASIVLNGEFYSRHILLNIHLWIVGESFLFISPKEFLLYVKHLLDRMRMILEKQ